MLCFTVLIPNPIIQPDYQPNFKTRLLPSITRIYIMATRISHPIIFFSIYFCVRVTIIHSDEVSFALCWLDIFCLVYFLLPTYASSLYNYFLVNAYIFREIVENVKC